jgi:pilus assembly protein FimV
LSKRFLYLVQVLVAVALISIGLNGHAVRMGALSVDSALGEPLSASIRLYDAEGVAVNAVTVSMAPPSVYDSLGLIYNDLISRINLRYENAANGPIVRLSTQGPVNEVVLDLQVEFVGPEGNVSKTYVAFIDPPFLADERLSLSTLESELLSIEESAEKILTEQGIEPSDLVVSREAIEIEPTDNNAVERPENIETMPEIVDEVNIIETDFVSSARQIVVRPGDTLTKIAQREKLSDFSLEQMLVGIFRKNREAFVGDNMNRLRAGNVIRIPVESELQAIPTKEATSEIRIHMADWRAHKDSLAVRPTFQAQTTTERAGRSESGVVEAASDQVNVQTQSESAYVVEVSKGSGDMDLGSQGLEERLIATEKQLEEQKARAGELEKIIAELTSLAQSKQNLGSAIQSADGQGITAPKKSTQGDAGAPWQAKIIEGVLHQPLYLLMPILALLIIGLWVSKRLNRLDDSNDEMMQPVGDNGERVGLDAAAFVQAGGTNVARDQDPVEDADIFIAYGRYPQAEKILKEALSLEPKRLDVLLKLAEVYSRQKDLANFDAVAERVADVTSQTGAYWERLVALGYLINPTNERYAEGKFASERQASVKPVDLSSIDLDLGNPPSPKA